MDLSGVRRRPWATSRIASASSLRPRVLLQVARRSGGDCLDDRILCGGGRQHQHPRVRPQLHDLPAGVHSVPVRHHHVHDDDFGRKALYHPHRLNPVSRQSDNLKVPLILQGVPQGVPHDGMVVRQHHPDLFRQRHPGLPSTATCRVSRIGCSHICAAGHTTEVADLWRPALGSSPTTGLGPAHGAGACPRWRRQARSTGAPPSSASACSGRRPRPSWRAAPPRWRRSARTRW